MQKLKAKILTAIIVATMALAAFPLMAMASTGYIRINVVAPAPSPLGLPVPAGGNVNLNFGGVTWSGGQFYLILSTNGFSDTSGAPYSATFDLVNLTDPVVVSTYTLPGIGSWQVGNNWVNGSIPLNISGGAYYIKAFDGLSTAVAVTDTSIIVTGTFKIVPTSGPGGAALVLQGYAFAANALANITYYNTSAPFNQIAIANLVQADALGQFNYSLTAPDLKLMVTPAGDSPSLPTPIIFNAKYTAGDGYNATYSEYPRGLKQISTTASGGNAVNLYGNGTISGLSRQVGQTVRFTGYNFYPGAISFVWDGVTTVNTTTANATGYFNTTMTVPLAAVGAHWVIIQDAGVSFYVQMDVAPTLILTPSRGPVGTTVTATGIGFSPSVGTSIYNVTLSWTPGTGTAYAIAWALTDATGQFTATFVVPHDSGGAHSVVATANVSGTTSNTPFTITPTMTVTPSSFANDPTLKVTAIGNGFDPTVFYMPNIDNNLLGVNPMPLNVSTGLYQTAVAANATGDLVVSFVGVGFSYGTHVLSLYGQSAVPTIWAAFNVTLTASDPTVSLLQQINQTVTGLSGLAGVNATLLTGISNGVATLVTNMGVVQTKLDAINATLIAINGNVATLSTNVGIIRANVSTITPMITTINSGIATVQTAVGTLQTTVSSLSGTLTSISGTVGTISTSVGAISSDLDSIGTKVTSIDGKTATIQTDLGTLSGTVTSTDGKVATIQTAIGTLQADVTGLKTSVADVPNQVSGQLSIPIWIAVVLALIAAIGAIASLLLVRRKIAG